MPDQREDVVILYIYIVLSSCLSLTLQAPTPVMKLFRSNAALR